MKKAGIVVVTYNAERYIKPLLTSLDRQNYPKEKFRVFVVDNNSSDNTVAEVDKWGREFGFGFPNGVASSSDSASLHRSPRNDIQLIKARKNLGFAAGNNVGMKRALEWGADFVVLLNQDMEVDEDWLGELVKKVESDDKLGAVQPMIVLARDRTKINSTGERLNYLGIGYSGNYQLSIINYQSRNNIISYASGAAVLFKREVLEKAGLFDESFFMYHEDSDLSWRARMAGWEIALAEKSKCFHDYRFNFKPKTYYWTEKNRLAFLLKNFEIKTLVLILPMFLVMEAGMMLYALAGGWFVWKIKSYGWVLKNLRGILRSRREVQKMRKARDKELKKYLVAGVEFGGLENPVLKYVANPVMKLYWWMIKWLV